MLLALSAHLAAASTFAPLRTHATVMRTYVRPGDPVEIHLALENRTEDALYFQEHTSSRCFIEKYVELDIKPPLIERPSAEACKPTAVKVMPGKSLSYTINLREVYSVPEEDTLMVVVKWKGAGAETYSPVSQRVDPIKFRAPFFDDRVKIGDQIHLPDKSTVVFLAHKSEKDSRPGKSPKLVFELKHLIPGKGEFESTVAVQLEDTVQFDFGGYRFEVINHQFQQFTDLRVFDR